jgi:hypothetical protein
MSSESKGNLVVATVVFVVGVVATVGAVIFLGGGQKPQVADLDAVMAAADSAPQDAASAAPQGAPMDSPAEAPQGAPMDSPATSQEEPSSAVTIVEGAPVPERDPAAGKPSLISQESLNLLNQVDPGGEGVDVFNFEKTKDGLYNKVSFKALGGFKYEVPDPEVVRAQADPTKAPGDQVPELLRKIDDAPVLVAGFMVPIDLDAEGNVRTFALTQDQMFCCYGVPPKMNEWVMVQMAEGHTTEYKNNIPVAVYGTLDIGEEIDDGYVLSLYRMTSDKVLDVRDLVKETRS